MSNSPLPPSGSQPDKRKRSPSPSETSMTTTTTNKICQVCGDAATIVNYGALSCLSCRTFFRRNAFPNREVVPCRFDGHCEVTLLNRRACTACRLNKCLAVGMTPDLIRKEDLTTQKRKSPRTTTEENRIELTASEKLLISNISHAFEKFSPINSIRTRLNDLNSSIDVSFSSSIISLCYKSLRSFIRSIPDFQVLTSEEQTSLFQRNLFAVLFLGTIFLLRQSTILHGTKFDEIFIVFYGHEFLEQTKSIAEEMPSDSTLFQLLIIALAFSSNSHFLSSSSSSSTTTTTTTASNPNANRDSLLFGTFRLFGSQNVYVELLWKYLLENNSNYLHAVKLYSNLIRNLLETLRLSQTIYTNNAIHQTSIDEILEENHQRISLWGKN